MNYKCGTVDRQKSHARGATAGLLRRHCTTSEPQKCHFWASSGFNALLGRAILPCRDGKNASHFSRLTENSCKTSDPRAVYGPWPTMQQMGGNQRPRLRLPARRLEAFLPPQPHPRPLLHAAGGQKTIISGGGLKKSGQMFAGNHVFSILLQGGSSWDTRM